MYRIFTLFATLFVALASAAQSTVSGDITWGYRLADSFAGDDHIKFIGVGKAGESEIGLKVPANDMLKGGILNAVRIPVREAAVVSNAKVNVYASDMATLLSSEDVDVSRMSDLSYTDVELSVPVTLDDDVVVSVVYTTSGSTAAAKNPIVYDNSVKTKGAFLLKSGTKFQDYTSSYGAFVLQVKVSGATLSNYSAVFEPATGTTRQDIVNTFDFPIVSNGAVDITDIDYGISVDGASEQEGHVKVSVPAGLSQKAVLPISFEAPHQIGQYEVKMRILKVNGQPNAKATEVTTFTFENISRFDRNCVMEEFTGMDCGYCTRGIAGMMKARAAYPDRFIGIAVHQFSGDLMNNWDYPSLCGNYVPACTYNREVAGDVYVDILQTVTKVISAVTPIDVHATAAFTDDSKKEVVVNASILSAVNASYEVVYALVGDGITGTNFIQTNYLYGDSQGKWDVTDDDPLSLFLAGGTYGKPYFRHTYDDVLLSSSYTSTVNQGGAFSLAADESTDRTYTLKLPTDKTLTDAIADSGYDLYAVVMVLNNFGYVTNACRVKVTDGSVGIGTIDRDAYEPREVSRYTIDGRRISGYTPGVNVVRMSDGTTRKIVVE